MRCGAPPRWALQRLRDTAAKRSGPVSVAWVPLPDCDRPAIVLAVSKRVGNAVVRNRVRRRLREAARQRLALPGGAYLLRAQPAAAELPFEALAGHLAKAAEAALTAAGARLAFGSPKREIAPK